MLIRITSLYQIRATVICELIETQIQRFQNWWLFDIIANRMRYRITYRWMTYRQMKQWCFNLAQLEEKLTNLTLLINSNTIYYYFFYLFWLLLFLSNSRSSERWYDILLPPIPTVLKRPLTFITEFRIIVWKLSSL